MLRLSRFGHEKRIPPIDLKRTLGGFFRLKEKVVYCSHLGGLGGHLRSKVEYLRTYLYLCIRQYEYLKPPGCPPKQPLGGFFVHTQIYNIRLLALCCAIKGQRRNSVIYSHDTVDRLSRRLKISAVSLKKYLIDLEQLGLIESNQYGHRTIVALRKIFPVLFPTWFEDGYGHTFKHVHFFAGLDKSIKFKEYINRIRYALVVPNFNQQQYHIDKKKFLFAKGKDRLSVDTGRKQIAAMKQHKVSSVAALECTLHSIQKIVTGKSHIAGIVGCSKSTAAKLLRDWTTARLFKRKIVTTFVKAKRFMDIHDQYDLLKCKFVGAAIVYCNTKLGFFINQGSEITLPLSPKASRLRK